MAPTPDKVHEQLALMQQQRLDAYSHMVEKSNDREASFNEALDNSRRKQAVKFTVNTLVQVYLSDLDYTFKTERKLLPKWGPVRRVMGRNRNSYKIATLEGLTLKGWFSARRLRSFTARPGTELDTDHKALREAVALIQSRAGVTDGEINDIEQAGDENEPDRPQHEHQKEAAQAALAWEREGTGATGSVTEPRSEGDGSGKGPNEEDDAGEDKQEDRIDDGMVLGGWAEPGRLRQRHCKQS